MDRFSRAASARTLLAAAPRAGARRSRLQARERRGDRLGRGADDRGRRRQGHEAGPRRAAGRARHDHRLPNEDVKISALVPGASWRCGSPRATRARGPGRGRDRTPGRSKTRSGRRRPPLAQAKAARENAKLNLERTERLFKRGIAAGKEVEDARAQQAAAEAALEKAQAVLDTADRQLSRAKSDVADLPAGREAPRRVSASRWTARAAQPLLEVANLDVVELAANVPADHLARVRVGQRCRDRLGRVRRPHVSRARHRDRAGRRPGHEHGAGPDRASTNAGHLLKIGMYAQARVGVGERKGVLTVPPSAVAKNEDGKRRSTS